VTGERGRSGWIFAAYVSETIGPWLDTAVITEPVGRGTRNYERDLYPGERVLIETRTKRRSFIVVLPDGERMELREDQVRFGEEER